MKSLKFVAAVLVLTAAVPAMAATANADLPVSANVAAVCTIETAEVAFGAYDPVVVNASTPKDADGSVTITCTRGAQNLRIDLAAGVNSANAVGTTRAMTDGAGAYLSYELYTDSAGGTVWGTGAGSGLAVANAPNVLPRTFTVFGRVPAAQDVPVGNYNDTVQATINY